MLCTYIHGYWLYCERAAGTALIVSYLWVVCGVVGVRAKRQSAFKSRKQGNANIQSCNITYTFITYIFMVGTIVYKYLQNVATNSRVDEAKIVTYRPT